jgi:hypothetical protein
MEFDPSPLMTLEQSSVAEEGERLAQPVGHETDGTACGFYVQPGNAVELSNTPQLQRRGFRGRPRGTGEDEGVEEEEAESVRQYRMAHKEDGGSVLFVRVARETMNSRLNRLQSAPGCSVLLQ